jgi:hypothetical protein
MVQSQPGHSLRDLISKIEHKDLILRGERERESERERERERNS